MQNGIAAQQQWYSGRYPYTHVPLSGVRFADASPIGTATLPPVELSQATGEGRDAPAAQSAQLNETIAELTETMRQMREENKSMFLAMSQRADTDADAARSNEEMTNQRCSSISGASYVAQRHPRAHTRRTSTLRVALPCCASCIGVCILGMENHFLDALKAESNSAEHTLCGDSRPL